MDKMPQTGDIVVCRISKVLDYGVFVKLLEFNDQAGFVHISQVSSSWIKNIRNFVKENQIRAAQVIAINSQKQQVDLSFNKVGSEKQRLKIEEFKQFKRSQKLIDILAKSQKISFEDAWKEVALPLLEKTDSLYDAFQAIRLEEHDLLLGIPKKWHAPLLELIEKNIEIPQKEVKGTLSLSSKEANGVELIRSALQSAQKAAKDAKVQIYYVGGGKYMVQVSSFDYKIAEKVLKQVGDAATDSMKAAKGQASFARLD